MTDMEKKVMVRLWAKRALQGRAAWWVELPHGKVQQTTVSES